MSIVHVGASAPYNVYIDEYALDDLGELVAGLSCDRACIVSDSTVAPLYAQRAQDSLERSGVASGRFVFAAGEQSKTIATYARCLDAFCEQGLTRSSVVVALGGGVVGDLAGFAAATYMRGCRCVQVPTSLLACVDSSVGGKTAVDLPAGKNLAGAFFQPELVLIDTSMLATLDEHYFFDGCGEVIKYGAIADAELFELLRRPMVPGDVRLGSVIARCVRIKRDVVSADEQERGLRQILNFGHTLGHAIERLSGFQTTHGFAVACGMALAARACAARGWCSAHDAQALVETLAAYGFTTEAPFGPEELYAAALSDKKRRGSAINVIALERMGTAVVKTLSLEDFREFVRQACAN